MMKPFEVGKTYPSRDGKRLYTVIADKIGEADHLLATFPDNGVKRHREFLADGVLNFLGYQNGLDMVHRSVERTGWVNIYPPNVNMEVTGYVWPSQRQADDMKKGDRIACVEIHWPEEEE